MNDNGILYVGGIVLMLLLAAAFAFGIMTFCVNFRKIWDYFFDAWNISIDSRGQETWISYYPDTSWNNISGLVGKQIPDSESKRNYVVYKYTHKFNKKEKLVKKYI